MHYRAHLAAGVASSAGVAAAVSAGWASTAVMISAGVLGASLPDVDTPTSTVSRALGSLGFVLRAGLRVIGHVIRVVPGMGGHGGHRGLTHSLPVGVVVVLLSWAVLGATGQELLAQVGEPVYAIRLWELSSLPELRAWGATNLPLGLGLGAGYFSHLILDLCTGNGVPLLAPLSARRFVLLPRPVRRLVDVIAAGVSY